MDTEPIPVDRTQSVSVPAARTPRTPRLGLLALTILSACALVLLSGFLRPSETVVRVETYPAPSAPVTEDPVASPQVTEPQAPVAPVDQDFGPRLKGPVELLDREAEIDELLEWQAERNACIESTPSYEVDENGVIRDVDPDC